MNLDSNEIEFSYSSTDLPICNSLCKATTHNTTVLCNCVSYVVVIYYDAGVQCTRSCQYT